MKAILKNLFILLMFLPFVVYAKNCSVLSGTGKNIGDEIKCGTENFYVVENKNSIIKMLAKYNLNVGDKIDYFTVENDTQYDPSSEYFPTVQDYCNNLATEKGYHQYYVYAILENINDGNHAPYYKMNGCRVYERMNEPNIRQDPRAVGTKLVNGKSVLPLYGITYMEPLWGYESIVNNNVHEVHYDENGDLIITGTPFENYINGYKSELEAQGYNVNSVKFVTLNKVLNLLETISGKEIEVNLEFPEIDYSELNSAEQFIGKMDIKEYLGDNYKWLYDVTYWLGSGYEITDEEGFLREGYRDFYISNEGMLCALGRGECIYLAYPIGNGVRPLVEISEENLVYPYNIESETDGHGDIEVVEQAYFEEAITFRVKPKPNYVISSITITTKDGDSVTYTEDQIIQNEDGTISVNSFIMPGSDVTIIAKFEYTPSAIENVIINPKTGVVRVEFILFVGLFIGLISFILLTKFKKKL